MSIDLSSLGVRALVLDIEGTTTSLDFVHRVLFPYARSRVAGFLAKRSRSAAVRGALAQLRGEQAVDHEAGEKPPDDLLAYVGWLMDRDRKSPGLKALQGLIWQEGYRAGELRGEVFADVPVAFERWRAKGLRLYIYSSGSVLAQRLLFESTEAGDLTAQLDGYFDTKVGSKMAAESYSTIARQLELPPAQILFVSDAVKELDAATAAGLRTALCVRDGGPDADRYLVIRSFDEIVTSR